MIRNNIREYRIKRCISRSELSKRIGVSVSYLSLLENGFRDNPTFDVVVKLIKCLDCKFEDLFVI